MLLVLGCVIITKVDQNIFLCFDEIKLLSVRTQT